jgi:hypothetical protein
MVRQRLGSLVTCGGLPQESGVVPPREDLKRQQLLQQSPNELFERLLDTVSAMEREGHAGSISRHLEETQ